MECVYLPSHPTFSSQHCKRSSALLCHCSTRTVDSPSLHGLESFRNMLHHRHTATFLSFAFISPHHFCHFFGTLNNQFEQYLFGIKFNSRSLVYSVFACNALCLRALCVCISLCILLAVPVCIRWINDMDFCHRYEIKWKSYLLAIFLRMLLCLTISHSENSQLVSVARMWMEHRRNNAIERVENREYNNKKEKTTACVRSRKCGRQKYLEKS